MDAGTVPSVVGPPPWSLVTIPADAVLRGLVYRRPTARLGRQNAVVSVVRRPVM